MPTKTAPQKKSVQIPPIAEWGVANYGVGLRLNDTPDYKFTGICSLDVEDDEQGNFIGLGLYDPAQNICFYWSELEIAKNVEIPFFVAHNGRSDLEKLKAWGFKTYQNYLVADTMLIAHILDSSRHSYSLKNLVKDTLGIEYPTYEDIVGKHKTKCPRTEPGCCGRVTLDKQPVDLVSEYNAMDCYSTYRLYEQQSESATAIDPEIFENVEKPIAFCFAEMEKKGIRVDLDYLKKLEGTLTVKYAELETIIKAELGDINLNSTQQLLAAIQSKGMKPMLKKKPSTDKRALERYKEVEIIDKLLQFREIETLLTSFVKPYLSRNQEIVHPQFLQVGTRTGRPACKDPNLLQIPKRSASGKLVRAMFVPREGNTFGETDYKEGEPRMLAHLSGDTKMIEMFNKGIGFHDYFAQKLNISRDKAKVFDLETYYRATKFGVSRHLNCSLNEAQKRIDEAWELFPELFDWEQKLIYTVKKDGYCTTLLGRRIKIDDLAHGNAFRREAAERQLMNNIAQASLQECTKLAMIRCHDDKINLIVQVYDSLLIEEKTEEIDAAMEVVINNMQSAMKLKVPLVVTAATGINWAECHA